MTITTNDLNHLKKFIEIYHKKELDDLKKRNVKTSLTIDYYEINDFFKEYANKQILDGSFTQLFKAYENELNIGRSNKNYIQLLMKDIPENVDFKKLDSSNNGDFISTTAMIKNISEIQTVPKVAVYNCRSCGRPYSMIISPNKPLELPTMCQECGSKSFDFDSDSSEYKNVRYVRLEEPLELRTGGRSRDFKAYMDNYLASPEYNLKAGDVCNISGKFEIVEEKRNKLKNFDFLINLHNITPVDSDFEEFHITEEDEEKINELSHNPNVFQKLCNTIAPDIYGYEFVKKGLVLQQFEGARPNKDSDDLLSDDRWTIHILLIGDPGIGKSRILQTVGKRVPKTITINGAGTTLSGLTSAAVKDDISGAWTLEAGAIVLADSGLLNIDEFDKLREEVQLALNEPMEQLSLSATKAGLQQTMTARTSVLAGANPKGSRFSDYSNFKSQLDIPDSTLSRFDLVFALRDTIDKSKDEKFAHNILKKSFKRNYSEDDLLDVDLFKKYINYAKNNIFPVLSDEAIDLLVKTYVQVRQEAKFLIEDGENAKPITARDLKCLERLSIARAKCELREIVTKEDVKDVIELYIASLKTVGLDLITAGERENIISDMEMKIINELKEAIDEAKSEYGLRIPKDVKSEIIKETIANNQFKVTTDNVEKLYTDALNQILEEL